MKILLVHNFYGSMAPSGENEVFLNENKLLQGTRQEVFQYTRHSNEIRNRGLAGTLQGALATPWNPFSLNELRKRIKDSQPDVMHVHNTFPLLSPVVFKSVRDTRTATVLTLHNYRTFCSAAIPMRNERPCVECMEQRSVYPALRYGCYRNSRTATLPLAVMIALHRKLGTWQKDVDAFIALSQFQKRMLSSAGLPGW